MSSLVHCLPVWVWPVSSNKKCLCIGIGYLESLTALLIFLRHHHHSPTTHIPAPCIAHARSISVLLSTVINAHPKNHLQYARAERCCWLKIESFLRKTKKYTKLNIEQLGRQSILYCNCNVELLWTIEKLYLSCNLLYILQCNCKIANCNCNCAASCRYCQLSANTSSAIAFKN